MESYNRKDEDLKDNFLKNLRKASSKLRITPEWCKVTLQNTIPSGLPKGHVDVWRGRMDGYRVLALRVKEENDLDELKRVCGCVQNTA